MKQYEIRKPKTMCPKVTGHSNTIRTGGRKCRKSAKHSKVPCRCWQEDRRRTEPLQSHVGLTVKLTSDDLRLQKHCAYQKGNLIQKIPYRLQGYDKK